MRAIGLGLVALALAGCRSDPPGPASPRLGQDPGADQGVIAGVVVPAVVEPDHAWAEDLVLPGLPNLHRVSPILYRGAQPEACGFDELQKLGVRTVVSLCAFHPDPHDLGAMTREWIAFKFWHPEDEDVVRFLKIATDPARQPLFVHCQHGADRTGMMCAIWRVAVEGWTKDEALREMTTGSFGYHASMKHMVDYVRRVDVARLSQCAGFECAKPRDRDS